MSDLPPTQYLIMDVLAARYRSGESLWTFPSSLAVPLRALEEQGLISVMHGIAPGSIRARLTDKGQDETLSPSYQLPVPTLATAISTIPSKDAHYLAWMREHGLGHGAGIGAVISAVRQDLQRLLGGAR